jgi:NO-binding membrane sensor protein with MHYT domain
MSDGPRNAVFHLPVDLHWIYYTFAISYTVSFAGALTSLMLVKRRTGKTGTRNRVLLSASSIIFGAVAIWSAHFCGMTAVTYSVAGVPIPFSFGASETIASLVVACSTVYFSFWLCADNKLSGWRSWTRTACGGMIAGAGVVSMHYIGMCAMLIGADMHLQAGVVAASVIIGLLACTTGLQIFFGLDRLWKADTRVLIACSGMLALAVNLMHYVGLLATTWTVSPGQTSPDLSHNLTPDLMMTISICLSVFVCSITLVAARHLNAWIAILGGTPDLEYLRPIVLVAVILNERDEILCTPQRNLPTVTIEQEYVGAGSFDDANRDFLRMLKSAWNTGGKTATAGWILEPRPSPGTSVTTINSPASTHSTNSVIPFNGPTVVTVSGDTGDCDVGRNTEVYSLGLLHRFERGYEHLKQEVRLSADEGMMWPRTNAGHLFIIRRCDHRTKQRHQSSGLYSFEASGAAATVLDNLTGVSDSVSMLTNFYSQVSTPLGSFDPDATGLDMHDTVYSTKLSPRDGHQLRSTEFEMSPSLRTQPSPDVVSRTTRPFPRLAWCVSSEDDALHREVHLSLLGVLYIRVFGTRTEVMVCTKGPLFIPHVVIEQELTGPDKNLSHMRTSSEQKYLEGWTTRGNASTDSANSTKPNEPTPVQDPTMSSTPAFARAVLKLGQAIGTPRDLHAGTFLPTSIKLSRNTSLSLFVVNSMSHDWPEGYIVRDLRFVPYATFDILVEGLFPSQAPPHWMRMAIAKSIERINPTQRGNLLHDTVI